MPRYNLRSGRNRLALNHSDIQFEPDDDDNDNVALASDVESDDSMEILNNIVVANQNRRQNRQPISARSEHNTRPQGRIKWTQDEYKEIMWCYYKCESDGMLSEKAVYDLWRQRNPVIHPNINNSKSLASQRRYIEKKRKLSDIELDSVKESLNDRPNRAALAPTLDASVDIVDQNENEHPVIIPHEVNFDPGIELNEDQMQLEHEILNVLASEEDMVSRGRLFKLYDSKKLNKHIANANVIIDQYFLGNPNSDLTSVNNLVYAIAKVITSKFIEHNENGNGYVRTSLVPKWKERIDKIVDLRKEVSLLYEVRVNPHSRKVRFKVENIKRKYQTYNLTKLEENIKQRISAYAQRIRRYTKRNDFFRQNKLFSTDKKKFYRILGKQNITVTNPPQPEQVEQFWKNIWSNSQSMNRNARWIQRERERVEDVEQMNEIHISEIDVREAVGDMQNWKTPGFDNIPTFWFKRLEAIHKHLARLYESLVENPDFCPDWFTQGNTVLLPKNQNTEDPKCWRPITCLPVMYKLLTSILKKKIYQHLEENSILPEEQRGCLKGSYGCKDLLLIDKLITEDCYKNKKNLSMCWIDFMKAYDCVSHEWIEEVLKLYHVDDKVVNFCSEIMKKWKTRLVINLDSPTTSINTGDIEQPQEITKIITNNIKIERGIFQGDSLSPLLFCMTLIPISSELNRSKNGYKLKNDSREISHLLYMDDIKLFSRTEVGLNSSIDVVKTMADDIGMSFGYDKCAKIILKRGVVTLVDSEQQTQESEQLIRDLEQDGYYKYLGMAENSRLQIHQIKDKIKSEYLRRLRLILNTELSGRNKIEAINSLAVPVVDYSFGIVDWTQEEIRNFDYKTRKLLTTHRMLHPRSNVNRIYLPRADGGRGLRNVQNSHQIAILRFATYIKRKSQNDELIKIIFDSMMNSERINLLKQAEKLERGLNINPNDITATSTKYLSRYRAHVKEKMRQHRKSEWKNMAMHGQFIRNIEESNTLDKNKCFDWLKLGKVKSETESFILSAQDQCLRTKYYEKHILKTSNDDKCRLCKTQPEHITHIVSGCEILAKQEYLTRHNKICSYLHFNICSHFSIPNIPDKWYKHNPEPVLQHGDIVMLYDQQIRTDRTIPCNKPDLVIKNMKEKTCILVDVSVPADTNVDKKEAEKRLKYRSLAIEIERMWGMKCTIVPVIIGALGCVPQSLEGNLALLPGKLSLSEIQMCAVLGTAHVMRKFGI